MRTWHMAAQYIPQNIPGKPSVITNGKLTEPVKGYIIKIECLETRQIIELTCDTGPELEMILTDLKRLKNIEITFPKLGGVIAKHPVPYKPGQTPTNTGVVHNTVSYTRGCICFSCKRITEEQDKKREEGHEPSCDDITELEKLAVELDELDEQGQVEQKTEDIHKRGSVQDLEWNTEQGAWLPVPKPRATWHSEQCCCKECNPKMWEGSDKYEQDCLYDAALMKHPENMYDDLRQPIEHSRFCTCFKCEDEKTQEQIKNMFP